MQSIRSALADNGTWLLVDIKARDTFEADYIRRVLTQHSGNVTRTAQALGLSRVMLQKKMKEYGLR